MSQFNDIERTRLRLNFMESPTFAGESTSDYSPITNLTLNLNEAKLSATPRRKLSLSGLEDTPSPFRIRKLQSDISDSAMDTSFTDRLLKNVIKLPGSSTTPSTGRGRILPRRVIMSPLLTGTPTQSNKENCSSSVLALTPDEAVGPSPFVSPTKPSGPVTHVSPAKNISPAKFLSPLRMRQPLEDYDPNSQDSGYIPLIQEKEEKSVFRFTEPVGAAPRRQLSTEQSPCKDLLTGSPRSRSSGYGSPQFFHSLSSGSGSGTESVDDGFLDLLESDKTNEDTQFPSGMGSLLSCPLKEQNSIKRDIFSVASRPRLNTRRSLSLIETSTRVQQSPFSFAKDECSTLSDSIRVFKRPEPPTENSFLQCLKRPKINPMPIISEDHSKTSLCSPSETVSSVRLQRSYSLTEATIKRALQRSSQEPDLIGDFSKPFILPLMEGRHQDLKAISCETLAKLMKGEYNTTIDSYTIVDCRYPYEFEGGHIKGAKNVFTQDQIYKEFVDANKSKPVSTSKRDILIFHCEFSSERGPKMSRFLRNSDRVLNKESYPALHYPEVYLLHGGYKEFFEKYSDLCEPCSYKPMLDPGHEADLRHFRSKSKSGDTKNRLALRGNLKRLGL